MQENTLPSQEEKQAEIERLAALCADRNEQIRKQMLLNSEQEDKILKFQEEIKERDKELDKFLVNQNSLLKSNQALEEEIEKHKYDISLFTLRNKQLQESNAKLIEALEIGINLGKELTYIADGYDEDLEKVKSALASTNKGGGE